MNEDQRKALARSLTAETTELLPFLPYLLQDLWELGSAPDEIAGLVRRHVAGPGPLRVLDLACGKGAVSVRLAREFGAEVTGVDLMPEFIAHARLMAKGHGVSELCRFMEGDAGEAVERERGYDLTIFGAAGDILGGPGETVARLSRTVRPDGHLIIDDAYARDGATVPMGPGGDPYPTYGMWLAAFERAEAALVEAIFADDAAMERTNERNNRLIAARARELMLLHPEKQDLFAGYIQSQLDECSDLEETIVAVTWLLRTPM